LRGRPRLSSLSPGSTSNQNCSQNPTRRSFWKRTGGAGLRTAHDRDRHQHRSYQRSSANEKSCAVFWKCWRAPVIPSHRDKIGAGDARHRYFGADAKRNLAKVALSVTSLDPKLARTMEPRPLRRQNGWKRCGNCRRRDSDHVMVAPVIPALNDAEIERILDAAAHAGVKEASYVLLRLPLEVRDLFREWLMANYPDRYRHVFTLIRDMRAAATTTRNGHADEGTGPMAWMIGRRFEIACEKFGSTKAFETDHGSFRAAETQRAAVEFVLGSLLYQRRPGLRAGPISVIYRLMKPVGRLRVTTTSGYGFRLGGRTTSSRLNSGNCAGFPVAPPGLLAHHPGHDSENPAKLQNCKGVIAIAPRVFGASAR